MIWGRIWLMFLLCCAPLGVQAQSMALELLLQEAILADAAETLPAGTRLEFLLPDETPADIRRLEALQHDLARAAFVARVETSNGTQVTLRGKVYAVVDLPVPLRPILPGEVTKPEDFDIRTLPVASLGRFTLSDLSQITGQEVRRILPEGRPVQSQSLQPQRVVRRGDRLTLTYSKGPLELTAPARALEDAAYGAQLRVQNLNSHKTVIGLAMGEGRVQVIQ